MCTGEKAEKIAVSAGKAAVVSRSAL